MHTKKGNRTIYDSILDTCHDLEGTAHGEPPSLTSEDEHWECLGGHSSDYESRRFTKAQTTADERTETS